MHLPRKPGAIEALTAEIRLRQKLQSSKLPHAIAERLASMGAAALLVPMPEDWPVFPTPTRPKSAHAMLTSALISSQQNFRKNAELDYFEPPRMVDRVPLRVRPGPGGGISAIIPVEPPPRAPGQKQRPQTARESGKTRISSRGSSRGSSRERGRARSASVTSAGSARRKSSRKKKKRLGLRAKLGDDLGLDQLIKKQNDPGKDGIPIDAVVQHLQAYNFFDSTVTAEMAREYLEAVGEGRNKPIYYAEIEPCCFQGNVSKMQVLAFINWASQCRGTTSAESIARVVNRNKTWSVKSLYRPPSSRKKRVARQCGRRFSPKRR